MDRFVDCKMKSVILPINTQEEEKQLTVSRPPKGRKRISNNALWGRLLESSDRPSLQFRCIALSSAWIASGPKASFTFRARFARTKEGAGTGSLLDLFVWPLMTTEAAEGRWPWPAAAEGIIPDNKSNPAFLPSESFCAAALSSRFLSFRCVVTTE